MINKDGTYQNDFDEKAPQNVLDSESEYERRFSKRKKNVRRASRSRVTTVRRWGILEFMFVVEDIIADACAMNYEDIWMIIGFFVLSNNCLSLNC